jgi:hypothetical protein
MWYFVVMCNNYCIIDVICGNHYVVIRGITV